MSYNRGYDNGGGYNRNGGGGYNNNRGGGGGGGYKNDYPQGSWDEAKDATPSFRDQRSMAPHDFKSNPNFIPIPDSKNKILGLKGKKHDDFEKNVVALTDLLNQDYHSSLFVSYKKKKY